MANPKEIRPDATMRALTGATSHDITGVPSRLDAGARPMTYSEFAFRAASGAVIHPMKPAVYRKIRRPDSEVMKLLGELGVATVHEAQGRVGLMKPYMRPIYAGAKVGGPAVTVS